MQSRWLRKLSQTIIRIGEAIYSPVPQGCSVFVAAFVLGPNVVSGRSRAQNVMRRGRLTYQNRHFWAKKEPKMAISVGFGLPMHASGLDGPQDPNLD